MQIRCYRCGWSIPISNDEIRFALEALRESGGKYHNVRCPRCRHTSKVSLKQLEKVAPRPKEEQSEEEE
jgi:ribosomal protein S27E